MTRKFFIAGVQFRPKDEINKAMKMLESGSFLHLIPEPMNKYDSNAIKILAKFFDEKDVDLVETVFLGYVPKKFSAEISALIENDFDVFCKVTKANPKGKTWEMLEVEVYTIENKEN
jgi:Zn ribbon nucleic-acid-binding protein